MDLKELIYFNKKKIIVFVGIFIIIGVSTLGYFYYSNYNKNDDRNVSDLSEENKLVLKKEENEVEEIIEMCFFDIKGEVNKPGVYSIECDKRLIDAINISGGLTKNSDTSVLNLSKKIEDGMVVIVYSKKEVNSYLETLEKEEKKLSICSNSNIKNDGCNNSNSSSNSNNSLININTASLSELMTLTGIGEAKAKNIISYRETTPFKSIEELQNVEGIGESIYVNIKENITV